MKYLLFILFAFMPDTATQVKHQVILDTIRNNEIVKQSSKMQIGMNRMSVKMDSLIKILELKKDTLK